MSRVLGWHNQAPEGCQGLLYSCAWCIAGLWIRLGTLHCCFCSCYTKKTYENWSWKLHFRVSRLSVNSSMIRKKGEVKPVFLQLVLGAARSKWAHERAERLEGRCSTPGAVLLPLRWADPPCLTALFPKKYCKESVFICQSFSWGALKRGSGWWCGLSSLKIFGAAHKALAGDSALSWALN